MDNPVTEHRPTPNKWVGGNTMEGIIIHWWGDPAAEPTFDGVVAHLTNPASQVSAHFVAQEGRVAQLAELTDRTWHAMQANQFTIGIECNPRKSEGDVKTVARLIAWIWQQVGRKIPIGTHNYYVATQCPGVWEPLVDSGELYKLAEQIYEGKEMITDEDVRKIARAVLDSPMKNYLGNDVTPQALLYWADANQGQQYRLLVEANERTKAIADAIAKGGEIDREAIERAVKEAVDKAMEGYELTLAPKQEGGK